MAATSPQEVTGLLLAWSEGEQTAFEKLVPLVYAELRRVAHRYMGGERPGHSLQTTALVNEAYLRLIDARRGTLWGLTAFACFSLAPAIGMPPQPPAAAEADLYERQLWWFGTAVATAVGLWLLAGHGRRWFVRVGGVVCLFLPHWIGAPATIGQNVVPAQLISQFAITSLATTGMFWLLVGAIGGFLYSRNQTGEE